MTFEWVTGNDIPQNHGDSELSLLACGTYANICEHIVALSRCMCHRIDAGPVSRYDLFCRFKMFRVFFFFL